MIHFKTKSVNCSTNINLIHPKSLPPNKVWILSSYLRPIKSDRGRNNNEEGPLVSIVTGQTYCLYCFTKTHVICQQNATILVYSKTTKIKVIFFFINIPLRTISTSQTIYIFINEFCFSHFYSAIANEEITSYVKYKSLFSLKITGFLSKNCNHNICNYIYCISNSNFNHILIRKTIADAKFALIQTI